MNNAQVSATPATAGKTPRLQMEKCLEDERWFVEHHSGKHDLVINVVQWKQSVFIYKCEDCTLQINGKVKRIILDGCKKFGVKFDGAISGLEICNSHRVKAEVCESQLPVVTISKTDGVTLYLNKESINCEVVSSCSSDINLVTPKDDDDQVWHHVADQLKTTWDGTKFVTKSD